MPSLSAVNLVRRSHLAEHQRHGIMLSLLRAFLFIWPISVLGAPAALGQAEVALLVWAAVLLIAAPAYPSLSPGLRLPVVPLGVAPRLVGALLGFRFVELLPVATLIAYRLATDTLPDATQVTLVVASLAAATGMVRALVDDLSLRWPRIFYRSPLTVVLLLPLVVGGVGRQVGMGPNEASVVGVTVALSVLPLYFTFVSNQGPILATIAVPNLTSTRYRRMVLAAIVLSGSGAFLGLLMLGLGTLMAMGVALAVAAIAGWWLAAVWGGSFGRGFLLLLVAAVLVGLPAGVVSAEVSAEQPLHAAAAVTGFAVVVMLAAAWRLCRVRDHQLTALWSR